MGLNLVFTSLSSLAPGTVGRRDKGQLEESPGVSTVRTLRQLRPLDPGACDGGLDVGLARPRPELLETWPSPGDTLALGKGQVTWANTSLS